MRDIKPDEHQKISSKLQKYISPESYTTLFTLSSLAFHNNMILHINDHIRKKVSSIKRTDLLSMGTCIGKFTKTNQFRITIQSIQLLSNYAIHKIWVKASAEMNFIYGNDILKSHVLKTSENILVNKHVFVFNQNDNVIGFGVASKSSSQYELCEGSAVVVIRQADVGEYLRDQSSLF